MAPRNNERFSRVGLQLPTSVAKQRAFCWDLLWDLSEGSGFPRNARHYALERAINLIERRFGEPLSVAEIARDGGVSYSYLSRLFQAELGTDVVDYIRERRSRHAIHLLRSSTLPIKAIAASVGLPDLTQFNRLMHRTCGCSPTEFRRSNQL